jgi:sulfite exporter TauE/SafE
MITSFLIGLLIGAGGSFHCLGMCGPLALSLPLNHARPVQASLSILLYNVGRVTTYTLAGVLFGAVGHTMALTGYQQFLSAGIGVLILAVLFFGNRIKTRPGFLNRFHNQVKIRLGKLLQKEKKTGGFFVIGLVNGLLPCGLVYLAIASAVATGSLLEGGVLMAGFGLGTIPLMFVLMVAGKYISAVFRQKIRQWVPYLVGFMACLLILRGLGLGIPYVSPAFAQSGKQEVQSCCSKDAGIQKPGHSH